ncbi:MAG: hypothetical protein Q4A16_09220 [Lautropia sp.]|nr:hypothetical protein [Lautropia sp.]
MNKYDLTHDQMLSTGTPTFNPLQAPRTLVAVCLSAGLLAACGGNGGNDQSGASNNAAGPSTLAVDTNALTVAQVFQDEPAAGPVMPAADHESMFHPEKLTPAVNVTETQPTIITPPSVVTDGGTVRVGKAVNRTFGQYRNGFIVSVSRTLDGVAVLDGDQESYTPTEADIGKKLVYHETVLNPDTNERIVASSEAITVIGASTPAAIKAPQFSVSGSMVKVGTPVTRVSGTYEQGEPVERFRLRNGVRIENSGEDSYTPVEADIGQRLIYAERVQNPVTGETITVYSQEVIVADVDGSIPQAAISLPSSHTTANNTATAKNSTSTRPVVTTAPRFAPANTIIMVGTPVTRVSGTYQNGVAYQGFRLRNGVEIHNGYGATYTPVAADVGQKLVYGERVRNPQTGETITVYSAEVTVVDAKAPSVRKAPIIALASRIRLGNTLTPTTGTYRDGQVYERLWMRDGVAIAGATGTSYRPVQADVGKNLTYGERVRNTANGKTATFYSAPVRIVGLDFPSMHSQPKMSVGTGNAVVGQTVTRTMGVYKNGTVAHARWYVNGEELGWGPRYTPKAADVGKRLVYREEVHSPSGEIVTFSTPAATVVAAPASTSTASTTTNSTSSSQSAATGSTSASSSRTINSVQTIIDDMRLANDSKLAGVNQSYGWAKGPGHVVMGNNPRGSNTPSYWSPYNTAYKSDAYWKAVIPWVVVFDGEGNQATNTRVQMRNLKLYIKRKSTNKWDKLVDERVSGANYPKSLQGDNVTTPDLRYETDGTRSVLPSGGNNLFHGWGNIANLDGWDVQAVFVTMQARLVVNDTSKPDDRSKARYLIHIGGDYYPETWTRVSHLAPSYYFPGIGLSRAKFVTNEWQSYNFANLDIAVQEPGGSITTQELRSNPPPLE